MDMDLFALIATEFEIPIMHTSQRIWFLRTKSGSYYEDFCLNGFVALGWDRITPDMIQDKRIHQDIKKERIESLYPNEKRPGLILSQVEIFYNKMQEGDLVLIPSKGGKKVTIGVVGKLIEDVSHKPGDYIICPFSHKRLVSWLKEIESYQDIYLFKVLHAQQTISDLTPESKLVLRNLFPIYIAGDSVHITLQKKSTRNLSLSSNVYLLLNMLELVNTTADLYHMSLSEEEVTLKTAVGSPGILEMILAGKPVSIIIAGIILRLFTGQVQSEDGSKASGISAIIKSINELINDYHNRKKTDAEADKIRAETELIRAQVEKTKAETKLITSQTAKTNAEARAAELTNQQLMLTDSGKTTEELRIEQENLVVPDTTQVEIYATRVSECGEKMLNAAKASGMTFGSKQGERVG